ncbi:MAG: hypothetical protein CMJ19_20525 [Phycisphaeraceae bacterium]|nr:hypothetical protein [Phycisphaeraceae bacterium]
MTQAANCYFQIKAQGIDTRQVPLVGSQQVIGRSPDVDITLPDQTVSRQHAEVYADAHGHWWIKDLHSRNGTLVNGQRITQDHMLAPDDAVQIEHFILQFNVHGEMPARRGVRAGTSMHGLNVSDKPTGPITRLDTQQAPPIDAVHLQTLIRFAEDLLTTPDPADRLLKLARILISKLYHGIAAVTIELDLNDPDTTPIPLIEPQYAHNWRSDEEPYVSRTLLRGVLEHQSPVIATNTDSADDSVMALSLADDKQTLAALACPITITDSNMQVLYATFPAEYGTADWLALATLAVEQYKQTNTAWVARLQAQEQAAIEKELRQASNIQNALIPLKIQLDQADIAIGFEPCKYVGGDYVDVRQSDTGKIYLTICDVCGKGMQAAIVTASLHALFHTAVDLGLPLTDLMTRFNKYLMKTLPGESFVTANMMIFDPATRELESVNAGHPPAMLIRPDGSVRKLSIGKHPPLGFIATEFESETVKLEPAELLCLYTDGLTESVNDENKMLHIAGVQDMLVKVYADHADMPTVELQNKLTRQLDEYEGNAPRADDRTFLLLKTDPQATQNTGTFDI